MTNERKLYKSIYFKSFSVLLLAITFIFIVNIYTYYLNIKESLYTELKNDTSITVEQIESLTKHFLKSYEVYEYEKLIRNFMNNKRIFAIVIDDYHTGKILGSNDGIYSTGSIRDKDWSVINYTKSHTKELNSSYFFVKKALLGDDTEEILGYISVYSSDKDIQENLKSLLISLILDKMVIFILIILVIFFIINRLILKPIDTLILSIRDKDSDGIPKNKLKLTNSVETNILIETINSMLDEISSSKAEIKLEKDRFSTFLSFSSDGIFIISIDDGGLIDYSNVASILLGYSYEEMKDLNIMDWDREIKSLDDYHKIVDRVGYEPISIERIHTRKDKTTYIASITAVRIKIEKREFIYSSVRDISEIKSLQKRYELLFNNAPDPYFIMELLDGKISDCNSSAIRILKASSKEQIIGLTPIELSPKYQDDGLSSCEKAILKLEGFIKDRYSKFDWIHTKFDGTNFWVNVTTSVIELDGRDVLFVAWRDITIEKELENQLIDSERKWSLVVEGNNDGLWDWNLKTNKVLFSKQWKLMLGFKEDEIGDSLDEWDRRIHIDDKKRVYADLERYLDGETKHYVNEHRVLCKDGSYKWILDRGLVIEYTDDGEPFRMVGTHIDIDENKKIREELKDLNRYLAEKVEEEVAERMREKTLSEQKERELLVTLQETQKIAKIASWSHNIIEDTLWYSDELYELFEIERETIPTIELLISLIYEEDRNKIIYKIKNPNKLTDVNNSDFRILTPRGNLKYMVINWRNSLNDSGAVIEIIGTIQDITEKVLLEQSNFQHQKKAAMGDLIGIIAHQLKQPLNSLVLEKEVMVMDYFDGALTEEDIKNYSTRVDSQINFMAQSIDDLRTFFRPDKTPKPFSITKSIEKAMSIVEKSISSKGIEIDKNLDIDSYIVGIDSELQQVIINIVTNSKDILVEKMIKEPIIKIATSKEHRKAIITIEDNGGGIPNNIIDKVFDSYFTTKGEGGTGIGLNLSKMIVEEGMHGKISVYNSDIGAVFKIAIDTVEIN